MRDGGIAPAFGKDGGGHQWVVIDKQTGQPVSVAELDDADIIFEPRVGAGN